MDSQEDTPIGVGRPCVELAGPEIATSRIRPVGRDVVMSKGTRSPGRPRIDGWSTDDSLGKETVFRSTHDQSLANRSDVWNAHSLSVE